jgi:3-hydroxyisobutyrate dehydrogenase-like beta-hydroxyacid dehydrogenase
VTDSESRPQAAAASSDPPTERVGFAGLGIMGSRMAAHVAAAGYPLTVYNRTEATAREWAAAHGAAVAPTPRELAAASDIVITMVTDAAAVRELLFGPDGVAAGAAHGSLCIDSSTIGAQATIAIGAQLEAAGVELVDAPVTGSAPRAQDATLTIMAGGSPDAFARARPLLETMGSLIVHVGALGQGQAVKVINNAVAAANAVAVAEALIAASAEGVDLDALIDVMRAGSGASAMLELKAAPMREHDFAPLFKLEHMLKDVRLCLEAATEARVPFGSAKRAAELLAAAAADGHGADDFAALATALERVAGQSITS